MGGGGGGYANEMRWECPHGPRPAVFVARRWWNLGRKGGRRPNQVPEMGGRTFFMSAP